MATKLDKVHSKKRKHEALNSEETDLISRSDHDRVVVSKDVSYFKFNKKRVEMRSKVIDLPDICQGVIYWMSRDQRVQDNWALLFAQRLALKHKLPLHIVFCLVPKFLEATYRHFHFIIEGLKSVEKECLQLEIPFHLLLGYPKDVLPKFVKENKIGAVVTDFAPLRVPRGWVKEVVEALPSNVPLAQVDAHNIVPCWFASDKQEYSARTIRKKIHDKLPEFLTSFPPVVKHPHSCKNKFKNVDWKLAYDSLEVDNSVEPTKGFIPGSTAGLEALRKFCEKRLKNFGTKRNDPNIDALSNLSPWIHFGQISAQRCILEVQKYKKEFPDSVNAYIEEAIIRRELADNYCYYQENYDNINGAYEWARKTLNDHKKDKRVYIYSKQELENSQTHDDLWNSAQIQMVTEGKMHGFLRMYWAKKILEWTVSPEEALSTAIYLNDKYSLDGRDPNGYVGCMWSICGIHDQGWGERAIFGKIRFMNYDGCKRKFNLKAFVARYGGKEISKKTTKK